MKAQLLLAVISILIIHISCNEDKHSNYINEDEIYNDLDTTKVSPSFFPVTVFLLSKIKEVSDCYPKIKYTNTENGHTDSVVMDANKMSLLLNEFLLPPIDSAAHAPFFSESKFNDETMGWVTLSYEPKGTIPDSIPWRRWDVHIDSETGEVKRIYMVKESASATTVQLTWLPASGCKMTYIDHSQPDHPFVKAEMNFRWVY